MAVVQPGSGSIQPPDRFYTNPWVTEPGAWRCCTLHPHNRRAGARLAAGWSLAIDQILILILLGGFLGQLPGNICCCGTGLGAGKHHKNRYG